MSGSSAPPPPATLPFHRSLIGSSAIFALGNGLSRVVSYVMPPALAAWLAPDEMGTVAVLTVFAIMLRTVLGFGVTTSAGALYFRSQDQGGRNAVIATSAILIAAGGVLGTLLCLGFGAWIGPRMLDGSHASGLLALAFGGVALQLLAQPFTMALQFQQRPGLHLAVTAATAAVGVILSLLFVAALGRGAQGWLEAAALSGALGVALAAFAADTKVHHWAPSVARDLIRIGWPFVPGAAFMAVVQGAGPFILARMEGIASAGIYNAGHSFGMLMSLATTGFGAAWFPLFQSYASRQDEAPAVFARVLSWSIAGFGAATILFYAGAPLAGLLIGDERYASATRVLGDVALVQALIGIWGILVPILYFREKIAWASAVQGLAAVVTIVATIVLVPLRGLDGASLGAVAGAMAMIIVQLAVNARMGSPVGRFAGWGHALSGLAVLVVVVAIRSVAPILAPLQTLLLGIAMAMTAFMLATVLSRRAGLL
ncbi:MAG: lipopolysaccharide biosynthesis protein [Burkholderiales bacterium]|nr:lipopolysaccharide biosynthesis protein [Burkholderiales bacterium]